MEASVELIKLYSNKSKHSNYQVLATRLLDIVSPGEISTTTRYERERLEYIVEKIDFANKSILDIGANTGYFSFEILDKGASHVDYVEGNREHARFAEVATRALGVEDKISVENKYYDFSGSDKHYDVALLFNVLHHTGGDYGDKDVSIDIAKENIMEQLNSMSKVADVLVFQLGFNWMGDTSKPLFENGTKKEQIDFIQESIEGFWKVRSIGVAEGNRDNVAYRDLTDRNIERDESLGEFLNRPIFILESMNEKHQKHN